jgi:hypothetical protein
MSSKDAWKSGGSTGVSHTRESVPTPPYRIFEPPRDIDLGQFDHIVVFGDSVLGHFVQHANETYRSKLTWKQNIGMDLRNASLHGVFTKKLRRWHNEELQKPNVALVLGSAVWDTMQGHSWEKQFGNHLAVCRAYVEHVRKEYPNVTVYWKSPSAVHVHRVFCRDQSCQARIKYMSSWRMKYLHDHQKAIMQEIGIPFLDVYESSYLSADWTQQGDGRHYVKDLNREITGWFFRNVTLNNLLPSRN